MNSSIKNYIKNCCRGIVRQFGRQYPELLVRVRYFVRFHKLLNLENPQTLNEKILYLSLKTDTSAWTNLADKYKVREFIKEKGYESLLVRLYGVWNNAKEIDFKNLPNSFVLKTNHGSGDTIIVNNKESLDIEKTRNTLQKTIGMPYGDLEGGKHYMRIQRKIIAEELLQNSDNDISSSIIDYKIWCFNGTPTYIFVCTNRKGCRFELSLYDTNWISHPEYIIETEHTHKAQSIRKPNVLKEMLDVAKNLSKDFPEVRVDLYCINNKIYFGEMTFTALGGLMNYFTDDFQKMAGNMITLNN